MRQQRDEKRRHHAQRRSLRGRAPAEPDRTEHRENDQRDRQDVDDHTPDDLLTRVARELLGRHGRGIILFHNGDDLDIDDVGRAQQQAGNDRAVKQLADGYVGGRAHKDQHDARRDKDAERAAGDDHARGEGLVVLRVQHRTDEQQTHRDHGRADDAGRRGKEDGDERRRDRHAAALAAEGDGEIIKQAAGHAGLIEQLPHQHKQRHCQKVIILAVFENAEIYGLEHVRPPEGETRQDRHAAERGKQVIAGENEHQQQDAHNGCDRKSADCHCSPSRFAARRRCTS